MFKNRKLFKDFVSAIKEGRYTKEEARNILETLPITVLRRIGKEIIYSDFDSYNGNATYNELMWFDDFDRSQKEFYIMERLHRLK